MLGGVGGVPGNRAPIPIVMVLLILSLNHYGMNLNTTILALWTRVARRQFKSKRFRMAIRASDRRHGIYDFINANVCLRPGLSGESHAGRGEVVVCATSSFPLSLDPPANRDRFTNSRTKRRVANTSECRKAIEAKAHCRAGVVTVPAEHAEIAAVALESSCHG